MVGFGNQMASRQGALLPGIGTEYNDWDVVAGRCEAQGAVFFGSRFLLAVVIQHNQVRGDLVCHSGCHLGIGTSTVSQPPRSRSVRSTSRVSEQRSTINTRDLVPSDLSDNSNPPCIGGIERGRLRFGEIAPRHSSKGLEWTPVRMSRAGRSVVSWAGDVKRETERPSKAEIMAKPSLAVTPAC